MTASVPRASGWSLVETRPLFAMLDGPRPGGGLLGVSDPDVHRIADRWVMFVGAVTTRFVVRVFEARLPVGASITDDGWRFVTDRRGRAKPLGAPQPGDWDVAGMHSPSYVRGEVAGDPVERIYYAGQLSRSMSGARSRYGIGILERTHGSGWVRRPGPVLRGDERRPSAMEPFVIFEGDRWRMWYLACRGEVGRGEQPDYELRYTESADGLTWGASERFATEDEGFFDNTVVRGVSGWLMLLARGTNLHGTKPFPEQGLWIAESATIPAGRSTWSSPVRLMNSDTTSEDWYGAGVCGPAAVQSDDRTLHVFATGTHLPVSWLKTASVRLLDGRRPPVPSPFYLTTSRFTYHLDDALDDAGPEPRPTDAAFPTAPQS